MVKQLLTIFFFCLPIYVLSQDIDRVKISGKLTAPVNEDVEGVTIYNVSSQQGTVTNPEGVFEIEVAENDRLAITALQFSTFIVIVDRGVIDKRKIGIYLNPVVNQLDEVIVRPYDLLGNVKADVARIKTIHIDSKMDLTYKSLNFDYEFSDDQYSAIRGNAAHNAFYNGQEQYGGDLIGLTAAIVNLFIQKKKKNSVKKPDTEISYVANGLRERFSNTYITEVFGIPEAKANDFLFFAEENGMDSKWLKEENEIRLLDFLYTSSAAYKKQSAQN